MNYIIPSPLSVATLLPEFSHLICCCDIPAFRCGCRIEALARQNPAVREMLKSLRFFEAVRAELFLDGDEIPLSVSERIASLKRQIEAVALRQEARLAA